MITSTPIKMIAVTNSDQYKQISKHKMIVATTVMRSNKIIIGLCSLIKWVILTGQMVTIIVKVQPMRTIYLPITLKTFIAQMICSMKTLQAQMQTLATLTISPLSQRSSHNCSTR